MSNGLLITGFSRKRLDQLLTELNDDMKAIFGDNLNLTPQSPDGQVNGVIAESQANLWEIAEQVHNAFNPSSSTGVSLSNLVQLNGIERKEATFSTVAIDVTGTDTTVIEAGRKISTSDTDSQFSIDADITIVGGVGSGTATAVLSGAVNALAGTLTNIDEPKAGWDTVTNAADADLGVNEETDAELRIRRRLSLATGAGSILEAILAAVLNVTDVTAVSLIENDTNATVGGVPAHSFHTVVNGGLDQDIADTIWNKKPTGILAFGSTTVPVIDSQGFSHDISFSRPTVINIYIDVAITPLTGFPTDGADQIKQAIVDYAAGILIEGRGFDIGDDVIYSEIYVPINTVDGVQVDDLFIGIAPSPSGTTTIAISADQVSDFDTSRINVT